MKTFIILSLVLISLVIGYVSYISWVEYSTFHPIASNATAILNELRAYCNEWDCIPVEPTKIPVAPVEIVPVSNETDEPFNIMDGLNIINPFR